MQQRFAKFTLYLRKRIIHICGKPEANLSNVLVFFNVAGVFKDWNCWGCRGKRISASLLKRLAKPECPQPLFFAPFEKFAQLSCALYKQNLRFSSSLFSIKWLFAKIEILQKHRGSWNLFQKAHDFRTEHKQSASRHFQSKHSAEIYPDPPRQAQGTIWLKNAGFQTTKKKGEGYNFSTHTKKTLTASKMGLDCIRVALLFSGRSVAKTLGEHDELLKSVSQKPKELKNSRSKMFFVKCH